MSWLQARTETGCCYIAEAVPACNRNGLESSVCALRVQALRPSAPSKDPVQRIASLVQSVILLREALTALPSLADALEPAKSELLKAVRKSL